MVERARVTWDRSNARRERRRGDAQTSSARMRCARAHRGQLKGGISILFFVLTLGFGWFSTAQAIAQPVDSKIRALTPDTRVPKLLEDADRAYNSGNLELALIQMKNAVRLAPTDGEARARLGLLLFKGGEFAAAERELRQAIVNMAPKDVVIPGLLQVMLARNELNELLMEFPEPARATQDLLAPDVLRARAVAFQMLKRTREANAASDRALEIRRDAPALITRAKLARMQNDTGLALRLTDEAIKRAPGDIEAQVLNISLMRQSGDAQKAMAFIDAFAARDPANSLPKVLRVEILLQLKRDAEAQSEVNTILKQNPNSALGTYYSAMLRMRANDFANAWRIAQNLSPYFVQSEPGIVMTVARMATGSGNLETGGAILASFLSLHPDAVEARLQLAAIYLSQKEPSAALAVLAPLENFKEPLVEALFAQAYLQLRRFNDAIASLESAMSSAGESDLLKQQLAMSQLQVGYTDQAIQGLRELLERNPANMEIASLLIGALIRNGSLDDALRVADGLTKNGAAKGALPAFLRGRVLFALGQHASAVTAYGEALAADPRFIPALYYRAYASLARGNSEDATRDLEGVLSRDPQQALAYVRLAQIALDSDQEARALALLTQGTRAVPNNPTLWLALANYQASRRNFRDAKAILLNLLKVSQNNPEALALLGQVQILLGEQRDGIDTLRRLVVEFPQSPAGYIVLAKALNTTKDPLAAEDAASGAVKLAPNSAQMRSLLIELQVAHGRTDNALETARSYRAEFPGSAADLLLADTLIRLKRTSEATTLLTTSLRTRPDRKIALRLGQIAMSLGDTKKSIAVLKSWLDAHPDDFEARREYASTLLAAGDNAGARQEFESLFKQRPQDPTVLNNLGWLLQATNPDRSHSLLSSAAKIAPRSADIADSLGWVTLQRRDHQAALPILQRAYKLDSDNPLISYHLAVALDANGKRSEAKTLLESIVARNAQFTDMDSAKQLLARW